MNILDRITARWLVGLVVVLTMLAHGSDAGRTARSGFDLGQAILSAADPTQPVLASEAPQGEIRFSAGDRQPHVGGKPAGDAILPSTLSLVPPGASRTPHVAPSTTLVRVALFVPGQRAPPTVLPKA
ncbi:MAG: hypothetical protein ACK4U0_19695 [Mesorhizobium sp.]